MISMHIKIFLKKIFLSLIICFSVSPVLADPTCSNQATAGYQVIDVGGNKTLSTPALSYVDDSFDFVVTVDDQPYLVTGSGSYSTVLTYGDLIDIFNSKIQNA